MPKRIVIVDDDMKLLGLLEVLFRDRGFKVFTSTRGVDGLGLIERERPDCAIVDMLLPGPHGLEVCARVKSDQSLKGTSVILMTSVYKTRKHRGEAIKAGADEWIQKPFRFAVLLALVEKLLNLPRSAAGSPLPADVPPPHSLRRSYLDELPERVSEIQEAWRQWEDESDAETLRAIHIMVHNLAGSAGSCGFHPISDAAQALEIELQQMADSAPQPENGATSRIGMLVSLLGTQALMAA